MNRKIKQIYYEVPMVWRKQVNRYFDCYFYMTKLPGFFQKKNKSKIKYSNCQSASEPVPHNLGNLFQFLLQKVTSKMKKPSKVM